MSSSVPARRRIILNRSPYLKSNGERGASNQGQERRYFLSCPLSLAPCPFLVWHRSRARSWFSMSVETIENRHQVLRQQERHHHPTHHNTRQRPLSLHPNWFN